MDIDRLVGDLKTTAALLHALKRRLRTSGHKTSPLEARELSRLKERATRLCALRAHLRGRLHLRSCARALGRSMTLEEQAAFVDDERQIYTLKAA